MANLSLKQGDSLRLVVAVQNDDGTAYNLSGVSVSAQVRDTLSKLIADLTLTPTGSTGQLSINQATDAWPTGTLRLDFKFLVGGVIMRSDTQTLIMQASITA